MIGTGMNAATGKPMEGIAHIRQSVAKILTTPIGSRIMRRDFGSLLPELIDAPINPRTRLQIMAATATAVIKWEPRIRPAKVSLELGQDLESATRLMVELTGTLRDGPRAGQTVTLSVPLAG